jgi:starch synthase
MKSNQKAGRMMRVLIAASEVVGFVKTGGLADVVGALGRALHQKGLDVRIIVPLYRQIREQHPLKFTGCKFSVPMGDRMVSGAVWEAKLPGSEVPVLCIEQGSYFERDDAAQGSGIYQYSGPGGAKIDYPDNGERFAFFNRAILAVIHRMGWWPEIIHCNDWQTGLVPVLLRQEADRDPNFTVARRWRTVRSLFTIHNIAYQGNFPPLMMYCARLPGHLFHPEAVEFHGQLSFLKAGLNFADRISTVSPTYALEIQTPWYGMGMEGLLTRRSAVLSGIVNGVDYNEWNPESDHQIPANFGPENVQPGKGVCKAALQKQLGLAVDPRVPVLGMIARMVEQKGFDLMGIALPTALRQGAQFVLLGDGDPWHRRTMEEIAARFPGQVSLNFGFNEPLAHLIEAGSDIYLMPSLYEPSGLNQLYSLKYGTIPVVRATGGLADTIVDATPDNLARESATGFHFGSYQADAFAKAMVRAIQTWRTQPDVWAQLMRTAMTRDWSWNKSADSYQELYRVTSNIR